MRSAMRERKKIVILGLLGNSVFMQVPHFHQKGETVQATSLYCEPGGKGSNQAVAAARLGAEVHFLTCMGEDATAAACVSFLQAEGVICHIQYTKEAASPYACILTDAEGENQVTVHRGASEFLSKDFVQKHRALIAEADVLLLNNECPMEANEAAVRIANENGTPAILNPAPYMDLPPDYLQRFTILTPNRHEAAMLGGISPKAKADELIRTLYDQLQRIVVATLGDEGAVCCDGQSLLLCPAMRCEAVDTTGAGDCFNAAFAVATAEGKSIDEALRQGVAASFLSVQKRYVMPSLPTGEQVSKVWEESPISTQISRRFFA